jgi:hypothetical protein
LMERLKAAPPSSWPLTCAKPVIERIGVIA